MDQLKLFIKKYFENFAFFYGHLRYRVFFVVIFSIAVGFLDGLGLTMFLPLLQLVGDSKQVDPDALGNLAFVVEFLQGLGINLTLFSVLLFMTLFFILKGAAVFFQGVYQVIVQQYFTRKIRVENIKGLNALSYRYFIQADVGRIQNTLTGEVDRVSKAFASYFLAFQQAILVVVYMVFAFMIDAQFAVLVCLGGVLTNFVFRSVYKKTKQASTALTKESNKFQGLIIQHVSNFKYLKATAFLDTYGDRLIQKIDEIQAQGKKIGILTSFLKGMREPLLILVVSSVILIQTSILGSPLGPIMISLLFFYRALVAVMGGQTAWNYFLGNSGSLDNLTSFTKSLKSNKEIKRSKESLVFKEKIQLRDISLNYGETQILNNINLQLPKNKTIAFVGESGSGKTTLVNMLAGLIPPSAGSIHMDQQMNVSLNNKGYQKKIGYITQEPVIFNDTIFNNVTLWKEKTEENVQKFWQVIKEASITDFLKDLPSKEETLLGNNGVNLSGGQRQRISIARELFKNIDILILDEATSALDSETELSIQQNMDALNGTCTILMVAHRLSTIKNADIIVLMSKGKILGSGSFEEMLENVPSFKRMVSLQEV
ncbi:ABC transporter ATP-binding protein [Pararhodonellum marinum]|uniref:ABC transporter ATP-binding protein n=1 Tax=Pararhodonellum marinum TaxID=2755358 RepID=UPI00188F432D|nr:ABC transporter ATP-binding protein [Pararhodonellum marinum]